MGEDKDRERVVFCHVCRTVLCQSCSVNFCEIARGRLVDMSAEDRVMWAYNHGHIEHWMHNAMLRTLGLPSERLHHDADVLRQKRVQKQAMNDRKSLAMA